MRQRVIDHGHANLEGGSQRQQDQEAEERNRYAGPGASDADRRALLLANLRDVPAERRTAHFQCVIALADPKELDNLLSAADYEKYLETAGGH